MAEFDGFDLRPPLMDSTEFYGIPEGYRLRWVKQHHYELGLEPEQYRDLYRIPYWALLGPEHGAPIEWFNESGLLLPKFRPGSPRAVEFQTWRRNYRRKSWITRRRHQWLEQSDVSAGTFVIVVLAMLVLAIGMREVVKAAWGESKSMIMPMAMGVSLFPLGWLAHGSILKASDVALIEWTLWQHRRKPRLQQRTD